MKNILAIVFVFWLLFLNGFSTIQTTIKQYNNAPAIISTGANRVIQTVKPLPNYEVTPIVSRVVVVVPTALPVPTPTAFVYPTVEPQRYPSANQEWYVKQTTDKGYICNCVYMTTLNKRVCWAPGILPSDSDAAWVVGMTEAGYIKGESIPE